MLYDAMIDVWSAALIQLMLCIVIAYHWGESDPESQHS